MKWNFLNELLNEFNFLNELLNEWTNGITWMNIQRNSENYRQEMWRIVYCITAMEYFILFYYLLEYFILLSL